MKTYLYHSKMFERDVKITFNDNGVFMSFEVIGGEDVKRNENAATKTNFYLSEAAFIQGAQENKVKYVEVARLITFEMFWKRYDHKICGRKKCEPLWDKLSQDDKVKAYDYIKPFQDKIKAQGTGMPYPTSYINSKAWVQ